MTIIDFLGKLLLPLNCTTQNPLLSDGIFEEIRKLLYHMIRLKQVYCFSSLRKQRCQIIGVREYISALIFLPLVKYVFCLFPISPHKCTKKTNKQTKQNKNKNRKANRKRLCFTWSNSSVLHCASCTALKKCACIPGINRPGEEVRWSLARERAHWPIFLIT